MSVQNSRREFFGIAAAVAGASLFSRHAAAGTSADVPALLGGTPVHKGGWPQWPEWRQAWEPSILDVLRSGRWYRGSGDGQVPRFEAAYAKLLGAKRCLATASGTTALIVGMHVLDVDAGDEVIVSPFTFIASYNAILSLKALPVLADTDPATLTMDPASITSRITDRTRAIMPVHIYGMPCDMDPIMSAARQKGIAVVEDACQAWLAEYKGRKCGTIGDLGCFSFQNSKHLPAGEGGAITSDRDDLMDRAASFHDCGRPYGSFKGPRPFFTRGGNYRMQHVQAAMLLQQLDKLRDDTARRGENANRLTGLLKEIPGVQPARLPEGSRAVWHLYPFRYDAGSFQGLPRDTFIKAMRAEGIPCSTGYLEQYLDGLLDEAIDSRGYKRLFSAQRLKAYRDSFHDLRGNREACETTVAITQNMLLAQPSDIDHIAAAIRKIQAHGARLAKA